jgi:signal transduction histidine kinase
MKLLNYTTSFFAVILFIIIPIWAALFYYNMLDEIYDSMDDGLDNQKLLVLQKARTDSSVFLRTNFDIGDYAIQEIPATQAGVMRDQYKDTLMYMKNEDEFEPVRMLRTVFTQNNRYYEMKVITSMVEEDDLIQQLFYALIWLYLGLVATILVMNNVLLRRVWQPFYTLLSNIKSFRLEAPQPVEDIPTKIDEFKLLNESVRKLIAGNVKAYTAQKQFIENAAHELQTPLAICMNKLEMFTDKYPLTDEQLQQLAEVINHIERAARLNQSLLLLTKIENKQFETSEKVNISELARSIVADFGELAEFKEVEIHLSEKAVCEAQMHPELARILITNLIKNAVVHNHKNGLVQVVIDKDRVEVQNTGSPAPLEAANIYKRFYKERTSHTSTGLGLAIAKAIADLYSLQLVYHYNKTHHFTIHFQ